MPHRHNRISLFAALRIAVTVLALGALLNMAVASGLALWSPVKVAVWRWSSGPFSQPPPVSVDISLPEPFLDPVQFQSLISHEYVTARAFGLEYSHYGETRMIPGITRGPFRADRAIFSHRAGWPALAMACTWDSKGHWTFRWRPDPPESWEGGLLAPARLVPRTVQTQPFAGPSYSRPIPVTPVWPGFAVNTLIYAAVLAMLLGIAWRLRALHRTRHGRCAACAYPIGVSPVCTECGRPVKSAAPTLAESSA